MFQRSFLRSARTNKTEKSDTPDIIIKNPFDDDIHVNGMEILLDSDFNVKGIAEITINGNIILDSENAGDFRKYKLFQIPLQDCILYRDQSIEIFIWNGIDNDFVGLSANISISKNSNMIALSGIPSDPDQINRHVSSSESENNVDSTSFALFEHKVYRNETITKLLNMNGNRNLIVTMSASEIILPTIIIGDHKLDTTGQIRIYDTHNNNEKELELILNLRTWSHYYNPSGPITVAVQISDDVEFETFELLNTLTQPYKGGSIGWKSKTHTILKTTTKRYLRIIVISASGIQEPECYNVSLIVKKFSGGSAKFSIQIKDASNNWQTLILSKEFGTITYGQQVLREIGESVSNHVLPSSQSLLRAVLEIEGGIETSVSIIKVA